MGLHYTINRRKAKAGATLLRGKKRLKHPLHLFPGHAGAVIGDNDFYHIPEVHTKVLISQDLGANADFTASRHRIRRIDEEVPEYLLKLIPVNFYEQILQGIIANHNGIFMGCVGRA